MSRFFQLTLRTSDVEAARRFYGSVFSVDPNLLNVVKLHEQAVARGARPHWLGFLDVADVDAAAQAFVSRGATMLGPRWVNPEGLEAAVVRDPGGAVVAVGKPPPTARAVHGGLDPVWHLLHTTDVERAKTNHRELFGWEFQAPLNLGELGVLHPFGWERGGAPVGALMAVEGREGVHPHWLFHFPVPDLSAAIAAIRGAGGTVLGPIVLPGGKAVAVCEDPQGAAFAVST